MQRLTKEISTWNRRAREIEEQERAGRTPRLNSAKAVQRADELETRRRKRLDELEQEAQLSPLPPVVVGGALVIPAGLLVRLKGQRNEQQPELLRVKPGGLSCRRCKP